MNRFDRALGILLMLRAGATISAAELARRFEVAPRTIYRDVEALSAVGVPVYAELGRNGGFRLSEGYFLPPIMFSAREATALLVGGMLLRRLRAMPFAADLDSATRKVLASLPEPMRAALMHAEQGISFETIPADLLHPEPADTLAAPGSRDPEHEGTLLSIFIEALIRRVAVVLRYRSPYRPLDVTEQAIAPCALVWDRDRWYLVGQPIGAAGPPRLWRADRVADLRVGDALGADAPNFDLRDVLDRRWLSTAMASWITQAPVVLQLTRAQAERLRQDWYYGHAQFTDLANDHVQMIFGEDDPIVVLTLLRWLGPGAKLLEPQAWRALLRAELRAMLDAAAD